MCKSPNWTPQLSADGVFYCSPACGGGKFCRKEWHDDAVKAADALALRLGPGWQPRVWENLGWHYEAVKGTARVYPDINKTGGKVDGAYPIAGYTAMILSKTQIIARADTPEDALGFAVHDARARARSIMNDLNDLLGEAEVAANG